MIYPVKELILPSDLIGASNGQINPALLRTVHSPNGSMHRIAATAWNCLQLAAFFDGVELNHVGAYRSLDAQTKLFLQRYSTTPTGRVPEVTRTWNGKTYYLKQGMAPSSSPGKSNHGWGLAIDVANASGSRLDWMLKGKDGKSPVLKFGFSWEVASGPNAESWHIRYVKGDVLTWAARRAIKVFPHLDVR